MQTVKSLPYLDIIWDPESRAVISTWKGGFMGRNLKEGLNEGLNEYKKHAPNAQWIGDTREIGVIGQEDQEWIDKEWFPAFLATGVKYMAVVQPSSAVAKMSVNSITSKVPGTMLTIHNCATLEEARAWIKQQKF